MTLAWWLCASFFGMAVQAMINVLLFPDGIDPSQQFRAGVLFVGQAVFFGALAVVLDRRSRRDR